eukprot:2013135-Rhodomonas_salina.2
MLRTVFPGEPCALNSPVSLGVVWLDSSTWLGWDSAPAPTFACCTPTAPTPDSRSLSAVLHQLFQARAVRIWSCNRNSKELQGGRTRGRTRRQRAEWLGGDGWHGCDTATTRLVWAGVARATSGVLVPTAMRDPSRPAARTRRHVLTTAGNGPLHCRHSLEQKFECIRTSNRKAIDAAADYSDDDPPDTRREWGVCVCMLLSHSVIQSSRTSSTNVVLVSQNPYKLFRTVLYFHTADNRRGTGRRANGN